MDVISVTNNADADGTLSKDISLARTAAPTVGIEILTYGGIAIVNLFRRPPAKGLCEAIVIGLKFMMSPGEKIKRKGDLMACNVSGNIARSANDPGIERPGVAQQPIERCRRLMIADKYCVSREGGVAAVAEHRYTGGLVNIRKKTLVRSAGTPGGDTDDSNAITKRVPRVEVLVYLIECNGFRLNLWISPWLRRWLVWYPHLELRHDALGKRQRI